jgi:predicted nucleotidyltransferase
MPKNEIGQYDFADRIVKAMQAVAPGSRVEFRGSLATKSADRYSDIDLRWIVSDNNFDEALERFPKILEQVGPLASLRSDREFQRSNKRRLIFVRFQDVPLFWRVDIEVFAESIADDPTYDVGNPEAWGEEWSRPIAPS